MFNRSTRRFDKGFTLIELLVTIAIIGTLAAIAIPMYASQQAQASRSAAVSDGRAWSGTISSALIGYSHLGVATANPFVISSPAANAQLAMNLPASSVPTANPGSASINVTGGAAGSIIVASSSGGAGTANVGWCMIVRNNGQTVAFTQAGLHAAVNPSVCNAATNLPS